jgi:hypothetical protein
MAPYHARVRADFLANQAERCHVGKSAGHGCQGMSPTLVDGDQRMTQTRHTQDSDDGQERRPGGGTGDAALAATEPSLGARRASGGGCVSAKGAAAGEGGGGLALSGAAASAGVASSASAVQLYDQLVSLGILRR